MLGAREAIGKVVVEVRSLMRAVVVRSLDGPDALELSEEFAEPVGAHPAADGERLLVEVHAAGVAFPDLLQSRGEYQIATPPPFVSGGEVAGVVLEAPDGSGFAVGDRVAGMTIWGAMAELALAVPKYTVQLPDAMSYAEGAALWLNYSTAWFGIERAGVLEGETVLVQGAAGGVGTAALDLLRGLGARSIAVVSSEEKERVARALGADGGRALRRAVARGGARVDGRAAASTSCSTRSAAIASPTRCARSTWPGG